MRKPLLVVIWWIIIIAVLQPKESVYRHFPRLIELKVKVIRTRVSSGFIKSASILVTVRD